MRQSGILAAAGLIALEQNVERLADDHALAKRLAETLEGGQHFHCPPSEVETNIVMARVLRPRPTPAELADALKERGVLVLPQNESTLRFVTHMDVGEADVENLRNALAQILKKS